MPNFKSLQSVLKVPSSFEDEEELYSKIPTEEEELEAYTSTPKWSPAQYKQSITPEHREELERQKKDRERTEEFEKFLEEDVGPLGALGYHVLKNIAFDERPPSEFEQGGGGVYEGMSPIDFVTPSGISSAAKGIGKAFTRPGIKKVAVSEILPAKRFEKIKQALPPITIEGKVVTPQIAAEERLALPAPATEEPLGLPMPRQELPAPATKEPLNLSIPKQELSVPTAKSVEAMPIAEAPIEVPVKTKPKAPSKDPNVPSRFVMPGMYSKAEQLITEKMGRSATPEQVMGILQGAKPEEVRFLAIKSFLEDKKKVSKDELLKHIQENTPEIKENIKQDTPEGNLVRKYQGLDRKVSYKEDNLIFRSPMLNNIDEDSELAERFEQISKNPDSPEYKQIKEQILELFNSPLSSSDIKKLQKIDGLQTKVKEVKNQIQEIQDQIDEINSKQDADVELEEKDRKIIDNLIQKLDRLDMKQSEFSDRQLAIIEDLYNETDSAVVKKLIENDEFNINDITGEGMMSGDEIDEISAIDYLNDLILKEKQSLAEDFEVHEDTHKDRLLEFENAKKELEEFLAQNPNISELTETDIKSRPIHSTTYDPSPKQKENYKERIYSYSPHRVELPDYKPSTGKREYTVGANSQGIGDIEDINNPDLAYLSPIAKLVFERFKREVERASPGVSSSFQNYLNNIKLKGVSSHYPSEGPFVLGHRRSSEFVDETGRKHLNVKEYQSDIHQKADERPSIEQQMPIKNWKEFQIKRMLIDAANGDFDNLTWSTGEQQAKLARKLETTTELKIENNGDGTFTLIPDFSVDPEFRTPQIKNLTLQKVNAILGKDVTQELLEKGEITRTSRDPIKMNFHGVSSYYDTTLPNFLYSFGRKFGKKPYKAVIPGTNQEFWTFEMTPEMREFIKKYGFPLFMLPAAMQQETPEEKKDFNKINKMVKDKNGKLL